MEERYHGVGNWYIISILYYYCSLLLAMRRIASIISIHVPPSLQLVRIAVSQNKGLK